MSTDLMAWWAMRCGAGERQNWATYRVTDVTVHCSVIAKLGTKKKVGLDRRIFVCCALFIFVDGSWKSAKNDGFTGWLSASCRHCLVVVVVVGSTPVNTRGDGVTRNGWLAGGGCWQNNEQQEMGFIWKNDENICLFFCLILSVVVRPGRPGRWRHINNAPAWVLPTLVMGCVGSWWCEVVWGTVNTNYRHRHHHTPQPDVTCDLWDIQYFSSVEERNDKNNSHQSPRSDWTGLDCVNFKCQPLIIIWTTDFLPEQGPGLVTL